MGDLNERLEFNVEPTEDDPSRGYCDFGDDCEALGLGGDQSLEDPERRQHAHWTYTYDARGRLVAKTLADRDGHGIYSLTYSYDCPR